MQISILFQKMSTLHCLFIDNKGQSNLFLNAETSSISKCKILDIQREAHKPAGAERKIYYINRVGRGRERESRRNGKKDVDGVHARRSSLLILPAYSGVASQAERFSAIVRAFFSPRLRVCSALY